MGALDSGAFDNGVADFLACLDTVKDWATQQDKSICASSRIRGRIECFV